MVFVLTDGSGSGGESRTASSVELLAANGCAAGSLMGGFTDREIYEAILSGDTGAVTDATLLLADDLVERGIESVVADAFEYYNPTHDLCAVMASLAVERAQIESGRTIARYAYAVTQTPEDGGMAIDLDDDALERKLATAYRFQDLRHEVDALVARVGVDRLRREVLHPVTPAVDLAPTVATPFYELRGEQRVAAGLYGTVLRYATHFVPFVRTLAAEVRAARTSPRRLYAS